ncbi:glycosyltransferase family 2 protein [bacterium]|nr:glycosyltransferase family 2 protein [bacterium]
MSSKDVSVIIVNYNTAQMTAESIKSVYEKTNGLDFDIFVVDNASKDNSCELIEQTFPEVKLIKSEENLGFGRANNLAIKESGAKYVFLLNSDTILKNNAVKILFDFMEENETVGACGGNLFNKEDKHTISYFNALNLKTKTVKTLCLTNFFPDVKARLKEKGFNENNELKEVEVISGADLMIRKSVLDEVGVFDSDFFLYFEETELQFRIRKAGYKIFIVPNSEIYHLEGATTTKNRKSRRYEFLRGEYLYLKKTNPPSKLFQIRIICMLSHFLRLFSSPKMIFKLWKFIWAN